MYLLSGPTIMMPGHGHGHMEHSNWRMINLPVGPLVDGKPIYTLYIALSIDFHLHYINDLMNKLIMTASVISILIVFIVLTCNRVPEFFSGIFHKIEQTHSYLIR